MELNGNIKLMLYGPELINIESDPVTDDDLEWLPKLKTMMRSIMGQAGGIGLAAPQVGVFKNFVLIQLRDGTVIDLVNPEITRLYGKEIDSPEGCLSIPPAGNECRVPRTEYVDIESEGIEYERRKWKFFHTDARVVQHELDHLTGTFFIDRVAEKKRRLVLERFEAWKFNWERLGRPFPYGGIHGNTGARALSCG